MLASEHKQPARAFSSGFVESAAVSWQPAPLHIAAPKALLVEAVAGETMPGDTLVMVGDDPRLGSWDPSQGVKLCTDELRYPTWHAWVVPGFCNACEYKFVLLRASGEAVWETIDNRKLAPLTTRVAAVFGSPHAISATASLDTQA